MNLKEKWKRRCQSRKRFTLFVSNENMSDIIKIMKPLEYSGVLMNGVTETVKHEFKKSEGGFRGALLAPLAASLVQPVISSLVKGINGRGIRRVGKGYIDKSF